MRGLSGWISVLFLLFALLAAGPAESACRNAIHKEAQNGSVTLGGDNAYPYYLNPRHNIPGHFMPPEGDMKDYPYNRLPGAERTYRHQARSV